MLNWQLVDAAEACAADCSSLKVMSSKKGHGHSSGGVKKGRRRGWVQSR